MEVKQMRSRQDRNYSFVILLLTILLTLLSAVTFAVTATTVHERSSIPAESTTVNTHSELWPWSTLNERTSSPVLELIDDPSIINKDVINVFVKRLLLSSSHSTVPHSAIDGTDFSDKIMITEDDFHIWMKDHIIKASNKEEFIIGFYGFTGEYNVAHSVYCIRKNALSKDGVWTEFTKDDMIAYLERSGETVIYADTPEISAESETDVEYIRDYGEIYTMGYSFLDRAVDYIYGIMLNSGFESVVDEFLPDFDDAVSKLNFKGCKNGDLLVISFYDTIPFKLHIFYDMKTETFCGWTRE